MSSEVTVRVDPSKVPPFSMSAVLAAEGFTKSTFAVSPSMEIESILPQNLGATGDSAGQMGQSPGSNAYAVSDSMAHEKKCSR